jgi:hypothetical protein
MKNTIRNKLFLPVKLCIFSLLATAFLPAHAEYYLVYATPEFDDLCVSCQHTTHHKKHQVSHKKASTTHHTVHHRHYKRSGLYVYYPNCPPTRAGCEDLWTCYHPNQVRSQWGDYIVFTSKPIDRRHGLPDEPYEDETSYNPDMSTADDSRPDLEIN